MNYEAEIIDGLKPFAKEEIGWFMRRRGRVLPDGADNEVRFQYEGDVRRLFELQTVVAVYECRHYPIPRPKALLGSQHLIALLRQIKAVRKLHPKGTFQTFKIAAAGKNSAVFQRLKTEIVKNTKMQVNEESPNMLIRIRRAKETGWEVLTRLTPRPLSARLWRVANMPGALNATVAAAIVSLTHPNHDDYFLNLTCGSGTLLVEREMSASCKLAIGADIDEVYLGMAKKNVRAGGTGAFLTHNDNRRLPFPDSTFNKIVADLPWGQLIGTHRDIQNLYLPVLRESARVAQDSGLFVVITHALRAFEQAKHQVPQWHVERTIKLRRGNLHPSIFVLRRRDRV